MLTRHKAASHGAATTVSRRQIWRAAMLAVALCAVVPAAAFAAPYEPNDTIQQATGPMTGGQNYDAAIETENDPDFYYFNVSGQRQIDVALTRLGGSCRSVALLDQDGQEVDYAYFGDVGETTHILRSTAYSTQYVLRVVQYEGCQYRLRVDPADALTTSPPGVIATLSGMQEADDIQRVYVDGRLVGSVQGKNGQSFDLGTLPPSSRITFEAENPSGSYYSWNATIVTHDARNQATIFSEEEYDYESSGATTGIVRRVVMTPSGGIVDTCGEKIAPSSCITKTVIPPPPPPPEPELGWLPLSTGSTQIRSLVVRNAPRIYGVRLRCVGIGCRRGINRTYRAARGSRTVSLTARVRGMRLRPGAYISLKVFRTGRPSTLYTYTMRRGQSPLRRVR
jgi:hypothetical protein